MVLKLFIVDLVLEKPNASSYICEVFGVAYSQLLGSIPISLLSSAEACLIEVYLKIKFFEFSLPIFITLKYDFDGNAWCAELRM